MTQDRTDYRDPRQLLLLGGIALAYYLTGRFGLGIYIAQGTATLVWPPTGIAIAAVLLAGPRVWPAIGAAALAVNLSIGLSLPGALAIAAGNTLEALVAVRLVRRFAGKNPFSTVRGNLLYVLLAGIVATNVSALTGATVSVLDHIRPLSAFGTLWVNWWVGDLAGAILLTPLIYLAGRRWLERHLPDSRSRWGTTGRHGEFLVVVVLAIVATQAVYMDWLPEQVSSHLTWIPFLAILWAARRFSQLATFAVSFAVSFFTIYSVLVTGSLTGPESVTGRLILLYLLLFLQAIAALVTAAFVHERRQMMRELRQAREEAQYALAQKSRFLANMSHELRTPLNGIVGMTTLMLSEATDPAQRERLRIIQSGADSLLGILNDVLDHARIESGQLSIQPRPFPLRQLVRDVTGLFQPQAALKGIALRATINEGVPDWVECDDIRLRQVLMNVISNAIKFTEAGEASLDVRSEPAEGERITLVMTVTDSGIGVPPEQQKRIFEAFVQADTSASRRHGGSGLGLTISRQLAIALGGTLDLRSEPGRGTTVVIRVPVRAVRPPVAATAGDTREPAVRRDFCRVLVAEDNPINALVVGQMLEKLGCAHTIAENGDRALAMLDDSYDLLLLDCQMPVMDGYATVRALRAAEARRGSGRLPVIALTASALPEERQRCVDAGMDDYLAKPITLSALQRMLEKHLAH